MTDWSAGQVAFFCGYVWTGLLVVYSIFLHRTRRPSKVHQSDADIESKEHGGGKAEVEGAPLLDEGGAIQKKSEPKDMFEDITRSAFVRCMVLDPVAIQEAYPVLLAMFEFGTIMAWFFLCDRTRVFGDGAGKGYNRDQFAFLFLILVIVAGKSSLQEVRTPLLLNRQQTEEWKGWMQVLFLLYHYFEAREMYNAIRVFIAGYVWMTGYGNFSYYYRSADFGVGRFCQMMWRLNFMVFFCCVVLQNNYMLYYICPMHTIFTVFVYACLGIAPHLNKSDSWVWVKIALCVVSIYVLWDIKAVFYGLWGPLTWLVGYIDPRKDPGQDILHEWYFRSGLDRYVWIHGMLCAFLHPSATRLLKRIDDMPRIRQAVARSVLLTAAGAVGVAWYINIYTLPKTEYNKVHPFTSWIPLSVWVVFRNVTPRLRTVHLRLFGWLGCITLETYLCQFHIWLHTSIPNGQPKLLLSFLPGYPLLNFALVSALYVFLSHRLFELTNSLKNAAVPHDNNRQLGRNILVMGIAGLGLYAASYGALRAASTI